MSSESETDNILRLKDGRTLGYAEYGDPNGRPVIFFHGTPGSRLEARFGEAVATKLGVRLIAPDRPGFGLSDFQARRAIGDWPADVLELADALGLERFAVGGLSGGGPYAAACALKIPERLTAAGIVSGAGPIGAPGATEGMSPRNRQLFTVGRRFPPLVPVYMWFMAQAVRRFPNWASSQLLRSFPEPDRKVLARPEVLRILMDDVSESLRRGSRGAAWELALFTRPWGFRLEDIEMEVHLWQGEADANVPATMGRYQAAAIPNCRATFYPGEGHLLIVDRMEEILGALLGPR